jgi:HD-like signal output (HDOD) protein
MDSEVLSPGSVRVALSRKESLPTLPATYTRLIRATANPNSSVSDLVEIITYDPILAGNVLHVANSAFAGLTEPVANLADAIMFLGIHEVSRIALSVGYFDVFATSGLSADFIKNIWFHSIAVALTSWRIASIGQFSFADDGYVAGLLHDIGKLFFATSFTKVYTGVRVRVAKEGNGLVFENEAFGLTHVEAGHELSQFWNLSPKVIEIVTCHHDPSKARDELKDLVLCVSAANIFVHELVQDEPIGNRLADAQEWFASLRSRAVHPEFFDLAKIRPILVQEIERARSLVATQSEK